MQAGGAHPPKLPWNPGLPAPYHYGVNLLIGLLAPPVGPDDHGVAGHIWMSRTSGGHNTHPVVAEVLAPLLITAGAWTTIGPLPPSIAQLPVVTGMTGETAGERLLATI